MKKVKKQNKQIAPKRAKSKKSTGGNVKGDLQTRNSKLLEEFAEYCRAYPEQRFFQALRNFINVGYVGISNDREHWSDTFYFENKND